MNIDQGKVAFESKADAEKVAQQMRKRHDEAFSVYRLVNGKWAIGGVFIKKKPAKKTRSLLDLKAIWAEYKEYDADTSVDDYVADIQKAEESSNQVGIPHGGDGIWTLVGQTIKTNEQLGIKRQGSYLVLEITNGIETVHPKMGGAFSRHIPFISRLAETLVDKPVIWSSWNPKNDPNKWGKNSWFYQLELNEGVSDDG